MAIVVEDGTGMANSNSYASETELDDYCDERAITLADGDAEAALIRASSALDGAYRMSYPGYRTLSRDQAMEWPRTAAYDYEGVMIDASTVPYEIKHATFEMAIREVAEPGIMTPDLERGGFIRRMKAGSVEIEYGGSNNQTIFTIIDGIMSKIIGYGATQSPMFGSTIRG